MPAGRVLTVMLVCLLVWTLLFAPELRRASEAQPLGVRRTVSLAVLAPIVWVSDLTRLSSVTDSVVRALGRGVEEEPRFPIDDLPTIPGPDLTPSPAPTVDTPIRVPTGEDRLRVAVVGDSLAAGVGFFAERVFKPFFVHVTKQGRISTGLARPDYFNWPGAMKQIVEAYRPDIVIVMLGENDNQSLLTTGGRARDPDRDGRLARRVRGARRTLRELATRGGAHVVWVGLPVERDGSRWTFIERQNTIYERVADRLPNVAYLDSWELFARPDGGYTAYYKRREPDRARARGRRRALHRGGLHHLDGARRDARRARTSSSTRRPTRPDRRKPVSG